MHYAQMYTYGSYHQHTDTHTRKKNDWGGKKKKAPDDLIQKERERRRDGNAALTACFESRDKRDEITQ